MKEKFLNSLALFGSAGTLLCCALPALLVSLGAGATMLSLTTAFPQLIWIGEHKTYVFVFAFLMLTLSSGLAWRNRNAPCPLDPRLRDACIRGRQFSRMTLMVSWLFFTIGFFFSYVAVYVLG